MCDYSQFNNLIYEVPEVNIGDYPLVSREQMLQMSISFINSSQETETFIFLRVKEKGKCGQEDNGLESRNQESYIHKTNDTEEIYLDVYVWECNPFCEEDTNYHRFILTRGKRLPPMQEELFNEYFVEKKILRTGEYNRLISGVAKIYFPEIHMRDYEALSKDIWKGSCQGEWENAIDRSDQIAMKEALTDLSNQALLHFYYALHPCVNEILFKADLDYLAMNSQRITEKNLMGTTPSEILGDIPIKLLKKLDSEQGLEVLQTVEDTDYFRDVLTEVSQDIKGLFTKAQCMYIQDCYKADMWCDKKTLEYFANVKAARYDRVVKYIKYAEMVKDYYKLPEFPESQVRNSGNEQSFAELLEEVRKAEVIYGVMVNHFRYDEMLRDQLIIHKDYKYETEDYELVQAGSVKQFLNLAQHMKNCLWEYIPRITRGYCSIIFICPKGSSSDSHSGSPAGSPAGRTNYPIAAMELQGQHLVQAFCCGNQPLAGDVDRFVKNFVNYYNIL